MTDAKPTIYNPQDYAELYAQVAALHINMARMNDTNNLAPLYYRINTMLGLPKEKQLTQVNIVARARDPQGQQYLEDFTTAIYNYAVAKDSKSDRAPQHMLSGFLADLEREFERTHSGAGEGVKMVYPLKGYKAEAPQLAIAAPPAAASRVVVTPTQAPTPQTRS